MSYPIPSVPTTDNLYKFLAYAAIVAALGGMFWIVADGWAAGRNAAEFSRITGKLEAHWQRIHQDNQAMNSTAHNLNDFPLLKQRILGEISGDDPKTLPIPNTQELQAQQAAHEAAVNKATARYEATVQKSFEESQSLNDELRALSVTQKTDWFFPIAQALLFVFAIFAGTYGFMKWYQFQHIDDTKKVYGDDKPESVFVMPRLRVGLYLMIVGALLLIPAAIFYPLFFDGAVAELAGDADEHGHVAKKTIDAIQKHCENVEKSRRERNKRKGKEEAEEEPEPEHKRVITTDYAISHVVAFAPYVETASHELPQVIKLSRQTERQRIMERQLLTYKIIAFSCFGLGLVLFCVGTCKRTKTKVVAVAPPAEPVTKSG